jgi:RES domain-containing protein
MRKRASGHAITVQQIASLPRLPYIGNAFRQQSPEFDPRSGEGARQFGGRFNPPASFATLYVAPTMTTAAAELFRQGEQHAIGIQALLPRDVYGYSLDFRAVIDLTTDEVRRILAVGESDLTNADRSMTQLIGEAAFGLGVQALISYSAVCDGLIIAIFLENLHGCDIRPELVDNWINTDQVKRSAKPDGAPT